MYHEHGDTPVLPSILPAIANLDNDAYEELLDRDKDLYWHFWIGEEHFRIPKPFEVGLIFATVPERAVAALAGEDDARKFLERLRWGWTPWPSPARSPAPSASRCLPRWPRWPRAGTASASARSRTSA